MEQADFRSNQIYLKTTYECGCVVTTCPPPPACPHHIGKKIKGVREEKRESEGKQLKLNQQDALDHDQQVAQSQIAEAKAIEAAIEDAKQVPLKEEEPRVVKHLGVGVSDNLGEHWADEVN
jgi:hypothetical protein